MFKWHERHAGRADEATVPAMSWSDVPLMMTTDELQSLVHARWQERVAGALRDRGWRPARHEASIGPVPWEEVASAAVETIWRDVEAIVAPIVGLLAPTPVVDVVQEQPTRARRPLTCYCAAPSAGFEPATHGLGISPGVSRWAQGAQGRRSERCAVARRRVLRTRFRRRDGQLDGQLGGRQRAWDRLFHASEQRADGQVSAPELVLAGQSRRERPVPKP